MCTIKGLLLPKKCLLLKFCESGLRQEIQELRNSLKQTFYLDGNTSKKDKLFSVIVLKGFMRAEMRFASFTSESLAW